MIRPCSGPASDRSWFGAPKRSTPCLRNLAAQSSWSASISAWCDRASAEMVAWPGRSATCQPAAMPGRHGGLLGAHHLSRKLQLLGHNARLMPAKYVRPYSKGQKNDFRDAEAIAEAVQRPTMK